MKSGATVCQHHTIQALSAMKLKIKQLSGSTTELDIEGGDTISSHCQGMQIKSVATLIL